MVRLDMINKQAAVHKYYHINSRNNQWMMQMQLKLIEEEYYYIEN